MLVLTCWEIGDAAADPWPTMLQDAVHSGLIGHSLELPSATPKIKWKYQANSEVESSAVLSSTRLFAAGGNTIFALNKQTGERVWAFEAQSQVLASGALGGELYMVGTDDKNFYALRQDTGKLAWKFKAGEFTGGAVVGDEGGVGVVYVGSSANKLHAYWLNGTRRFNFKTTGNVASTPALDKQGIYFGDDSGTFYKLDRASGKLVWKAKFESGIRSPARLHHEDIFISIGDPDDKMSGAIVRLGYDGSVKWQSDCSVEGEKKKSSKCGSCWTSPAIIDDSGVVVAGCGLDTKHEGTVWGLFKDTGAVKWAFKAKNDCQTSSPVVVGKDAIIIGCTDGKLYALSASDGKLLWKFKAKKGFWATPALDYDGTIFIGSHDGHVYALGGNDTKAEL